MNLIATFKYLYFAIYLTGIVSALYSVLKIFPANSTTDKNRYLILRIVSISFWFYSLYLIWHSNSPWYLHVTGIALSGLGTLVFWWARYAIQNKGLALIFSKTAPKDIANSGPYKFIRHPFYTSYLLIYASALLVELNLICSALFICIFVIYYLAAVQEEKNLLASEHGTKYQEVINTRGRFLPRILSVK